MDYTTPRNMPLFGAEDLRAIERVNNEISRNAKTGKRARKAEAPLFADDDSDRDPWTMSYGGTKIGSFSL